MNPDLLALLSRLAVAERGVIWEIDGHLHETFDPGALNQAIKMGLVKLDNGSGWGAHVGVRLTNKGRQTMGLSIPTTAWQRLLAGFRGLVTSTSR